MSETSKSVPAPVRHWREVAASRDTGKLDALLADDVVFHSPVVHTAQQGRALTKAYLGSALAVLGKEHFQYVGQWFGKDSAVLEFVTRLDDIEVNGVDIIGWDEQGKINSFKVMVRPLKAIQAVREKMASTLAAMQQQQQQQQQQQ